MQDLFKINLFELDDVVMRSLFSLIALFFITKLLGKKQVAELSIFDYVIGISIGNFSAEMTTNIDIPWINGIIAIVIFGLVSYLISILSMKNIKIRRFMYGTPTILIEKGNIIESGLKKVKFDVNDLLEECRGSGYFDLKQIETAIMEINGTLSILPKTDYRPLTVGDMNLKFNQEGLCANVVIDGKIMDNNLKNMNKDKKWLLKKIKEKGYSSVEPLLLVTLDNNDKIEIYEKNKEKKIKPVLE